MYDFPVLIGPHIDRTESGYGMDFSNSKASGTRYKLERWMSVFFATVFVAKSYSWSFGNMSGIELPYFPAAPGFIG